MVAFAVALGAFTRPRAALLMVFYTLATSAIEHRYWAVKGANQLDSMEAFYKNLGIMGGFLLLFMTGAGNYSLDALLERHRAMSRVLEREGPCIFCSPVLGWTDIALTLNRVAARGVLHAVGLSQAVQRRAPPHHRG